MSDRREQRCFLGRTLTKPSPSSRTIPTTAYFAVSATLNPGNDSLTTS
jgi:hypothetical protein